MVRGRTLRLGQDAADLAEGTRTSGVNIQALTNRSAFPVWIGEVGDGYRLDPGQSFPGPITLGSTDRLPIVADLGDEDDGEAEVDILLGYDEVIPT